MEQISSVIDTKAGIKSIKNNILTIINSNNEKMKKQSFYTGLMNNSRGVSLFKYHKMTDEWNGSKASYINNLTAFKCVVYWKVDKDGKKHYKPSKGNRFYADSYDWQYSKNEQLYVNEQMALMKLVNMVEKQFLGKYISAYIFANIGNEQYTVRAYLPYHPTPKLRVQKNYAEFKEVKRNGLTNVLLSKIKSNFVTEIDNINEFIN